MYIYRYPPKTLDKVYYPSNGMRTYYSVPFKIRAECNNVLIFYRYETMIPKFEEQIDIKTIEMKELSYLTSIMKMPAIVVLNQYCSLDERQESFDIHYVRQQSYKDCLNEKKINDVN